MNQRKPPGERSRRHGSENRHRQTSVHVRLNRDEYSVLALTAARTGKPMARLLRDAFLASVKVEVQ